MSCYGRQREVTLSNSGSTPETSTGIIIDHFHTIMALPIFGDAIIVCGIATFTIIM